MTKMEDDSNAMYRPSAERLGASLDAVPSAPVADTLMRLMGKLAALGAVCSHCDGKTSPITY